MIPGSHPSSLFGNLIAGIGVNFDAIDSPIEHLEFSTIFID
jgi:hypothetical protein